MYTKCDKPISIKPIPDIATVTKLKNVGRCDHTFAHHMAHMGDDDPENVVVFICAEITQCVGCTPSSRRRVDGVEVDATIQRERAVTFDFHTGNYMQDILA